MPGLPPIANVVLVKLKGTIGLGRWNNIFYLQYTGTAPSTGDLTTLANNIATAWSTNLAPMAPATVALTEVDLADLSNSTAATAQVSIAAIPGTRAGTANTNQACMVASWQINHRYRGGHPRTYFPFGVQADVTNGSLWTTAFHTAAVTAINAWRTALNALTTGSTSYKMISVSYYVGGAVRPAPLPFTINGGVVHGRVDTQRSRLGRETP
jgi:hypothetical protein